MDHASKLIPVNVAVLVQSLSFLIYMAKAQHDISEQINNYEENELIGNFPKWVIAGTAILLGGTIVNLAYVLTCKTKIVLQLGCAGILIGIVLISIGECIWLNKQLESTYTADTALWIGQVATGLLVIHESMPQLR